MKVLVAGASGLVGRDLTSLLTETNIEWIGTYNSNPFHNSYKVNFLDIEEVDIFISTYKPTTCINCIAERNVDLCETNWNHTKQVNIKITENIAAICNKYNIHLIHISTDYVFDGKLQPFAPDSITNPLQNYGISKLIAEKRVQAICNEGCIIRVPVLYTHNTIRLDETAIGLIGKKVLNRLEVFTEDNLNIRRPLYIPDLCKFIYNNIINIKRGVYHFYNPYDKYTKYEISQVITKYLHKTSTITPIIPMLNSERPYDTQFIDTQYKIEDYSITSLVRGIEECFSKLYHPLLSFDRKPSESIFIVLDMDGTLIDTDNLHYNAYKLALLEYNIELEYDKYINIIRIDDYLASLFEENIVQDIKTKKNKYLQKNTNIKFMDGAKKLIEWIADFNINHVVVTNTSNNNVNYFKEVLPTLNLLKNWVTREDTVKSKPDPEPYLYAKDKFYKNEKYIIGFENTYSGYMSLKAITSCIYIITEKNTVTYNKMKNEDVYLINSFYSLNNSVPK